MVQLAEFKSKQYMNLSAVFVMDMRKSDRSSSSSNVVNLLWQFRDSIEYWKRLLMLSVKIAILYHIHIHTCTIQWIRYETDHQNSIHFVSFHFCVIYICGYARLQYTTWWSTRLQLLYHSNIVKHENYIYFMIDISVWIFFSLHDIHCLYIQ